MERGEIEKPNIRVWVGHPLVESTSPEAVDYGSPSIEYDFDISNREPLRDQIIHAMTFWKGNIVMTRNSFRRSRESAEKFIQALDTGLATGRISPFIDVIPQNPEQELQPLTGNRLFIKVDTDLSDLSDEDIDSIVGRSQKLIFAALNLEDENT